MRNKKCSNNGRLLAYFTRLVFLLLVSISVSQITCTVIFMLLCRQSSRDLVLTLDLSVDPCKGQGIPAYFAFLILLVTVFGFGCVGRKATSVILFLLATFDVASSTYLEILESNQDFSQILQDVNQTSALCVGYNSSLNISSPSYGNFKTCDKINSILEETCNVLDQDTFSMEDFKILQNCSNSVIYILKDVKFRYHHISLPLILLASISYMVLSVILFTIQLHHKRLPGYRRREHILHRPEFKECPTSEDLVERDDGANMTLRLCLLNLIWCQCHAMCGNIYCCCKRRKKKKHDVYEFEALPNRQLHEDQMASVTHLV